LPAFNFDPGGYLSGAFIFDPGGFLKFDLHGFIKCTSALSSGETSGHQQQLFLHCPTEITSAQSSSRHPSSSALYCSTSFMVKVFDDLPVTAMSTTMAKWIDREMDTVQSDTVETRKNSSEVPYWQNGEKSYWHNEEQSMICYLFQILSYICELCFMVRNANFQMLYSYLCCQGDSITDAP